MVYSGLGLLENILQEEHVFQPQLAKISGSSFNNFSQSINIYNVVPIIPGTITAGAQGPLIKASNFSF